MSVEIIDNRLIVVNGKIVDMTDLPKKKYTVGGRATTSVEMCEIEAISKEHAKAIFKRDWDDNLGDPELDLDEDTIDVDEEKEDVILSFDGETISICGYTFEWLVKAVKEDGMEAKQVSEVLEHELLHLSHMRERKAVQNAKRGKALYELIHQKILEEGGGGLT